MLQNTSHTRLAGALLAIPALMALAPSAALAHHPMGGVTPYDFTTGFISGLAHPVIGLDHLAFIIAIGLLSLGTAHRFLMPLAFVGFTAAGTLLHMTGASLPAVEMVIALTVLAAGVLIVRRSAIPPVAIAGFFALAGLFHGYAYGEAIFGAEATPLLSYLAGFAVIQYAVAVAVMEGVRFVLSPTLGQAVPLRIAGGAVAGVALVFLRDQVLPF